MYRSNFCSENVSGKILEKDRKLFVAFMDLEKAYDRVDRKGLWDTLESIWGERAIS